MIKSCATCLTKRQCQSALSTVSVRATRSLHQDLMHSGCCGTVVLNVCLQAFSSFPLPSSPIDQRPVHRLRVKDTTCISILYECPNSYGSKTLEQEVCWIFNFPAASHHSGIWERCIRTTRRILNFSMSRS